jgi:hypothetical protein
LELGSVVRCYERGNELLGTEVWELPKILGVTSKFQALETWHEASSVLKAYKY